ncbi:hypothetical protein KR084_009626 [Drosophila pseudotakahashii]|nr:hypothetical protein KR084_009626 [Drosophila pseudotakahashii]
MSSCCGAETPKCCECPPGLRLEKTPQAPVFDMLGPHPDEVIMTILDRILYLSGATKIIPMLELAAYGSSLKKESCPPSSAGAASHCTSVSTSVPLSSSMWNTCCSKPPSTATTCCSNKPTSSCGSRKVPPVPCCPKVPTPPVPCTPCTPCTPKSCCKTSSRLSAAACCPRQRTPRVDFDHPADIIPLRKKAGSATTKERTNPSISTCSVACHQLKTKLASQEFSGGSGKDQRWLWTRLIRGNDGCMVYEVYKESDADKSPSRIGSEAPIILFLVMPNGYIMPFESICSP